MIKKTLIKSGTLRLAFLYLIDYNLADLHHQKLVLIVN